MFEYIKGKLVELRGTCAIVETAPFAYRITLPVNACTSLSIGEDLLLYLSHVVREESEQLFGFPHKEERDFFELLCSVTGIGPKTALLSLGHLPLQDLKFVIASGNAKALSSIPGIGKKTAERLIVEMKDKLRPGLAHTPGDRSLLSDALAALKHLGYGEHSAVKALQTILSRSGTTPELSALITEALKLL